MCFNVYHSSCHAHVFWRIVRLSVRLAIPSLEALQKSRLATVYTFFRAKGGDPDVSFSESSCPVDSSIANPVALLRTKIRLEHQGTKNAASIGTLIPHPPDSKRSSCPLPPNRCALRLHTLFAAAAVQQRADRRDRSRGDRELLRIKSYSGGTQKVTGTNLWLRIISYNK